jgi:sulfotransferase family protein
MRFGQGSRRFRLPRSARDVERRMLWILGSGRSGSTWLLNLLSWDPRVASIDEPGVGSHLGVTLAGMMNLPAAGVESGAFRLKDARNAASDYFFCAEYEPVWMPLLRDLILGRISAQVAKSGRGPHGAPAIVAIKEPNGSDAADLLMSALPRSRLLFLLRDGRDVVDSELDGTRTGSWVMQSYPGYRGSEEDRVTFIRDRATLWVRRIAVVQRAFDNHPEELRRLVRYEELLEDPEPILASLFDWMELSVERSQIRDSLATLAYERIPAEQRGPGQFVRAASPGLWKQNLSSEEQRLLDSVMGPKLRELGYR